MNVNMELFRAQLELHAEIDLVAALAIARIGSQAAEAQESISAMHNFAQRSIAQRRRWHVFKKINGGEK